MLESTIEKYFKASVRAHGGATRKWVSPGVRDVPDQIVIWPQNKTEYWRGGPLPTQAPPLIHFVEIKAPGEKPRPGQLREHARLRGLGCLVFVLDSKEAVDNYVRNK